METPSLRVALDANVLIAGILSPRWPFEVMRAATLGVFRVVLPEQVLVEARRHLPLPGQQAALEAFLTASGYEQVAMPSRERVSANLDLVRSAKDVPIALALLDAEVDIFVTNDRDFTDTAAAADRLIARVRIMLVAVFLRDVLGWRPESLEKIRHRRFEDLTSGGE
jgi:predicted nucleic acid-binding protein